MNEDLKELADAVIGTTRSNLMCPSCGYIKHKNVRNVDRDYVVVVWECPCGRRNHTKIATKKPLIQRIVGEE